MEDRLVDLETRLTFQEEAIDSLHRTLLLQQAALERMTGQLDQLQQRLVALTPSPIDDGTTEPPPPHY